MPKPSIKAQAARILKPPDGIVSLRLCEPDGRLKSRSRNRFSVNPTSAVRRILGLGLVLTSFLAFCQNRQADAQNTRWDFGAWAAEETGKETTSSLTEAQIFSAGVFAGKVLTGEVGSGWRRGRLEYLFDFMPVFVTSGNEKIQGYGFDPIILRWNAVRHTAHISPYAELSGGAAATTANLPAGDTSSFNFMAKAGGGIYVRMRPRQSLDIALRWSHLSNANLGDYNPAFNGIQLCVGYHFFK